MADLAKPLYALLTWSALALVWGAGSGLARDYRAELAPIIVQTAPTSIQPAAERRVRIRWQDVTATEAAATPLPVAAPANPAAAGAPPAGGDTALADEEDIDEGELDEDAVSDEDTFAEEDFEDEAAE